MGNVSVTKVTWSGSVGLPGVNVWHSNESPIFGPNLTALRTFYESIKTILPIGVTVSFPSSGDVLDEATGDLVGGWSAAPPLPVVATGSSAHAGGVGMVLHWGTNVIRNKHRVRGKTFIVPVTSGLYQPDGSISDAHVTMVRAAGQALVADPLALFGVYSRQRLLLPGAFAEHASVTVPDRVATLRSRRF